MADNEKKGDDKEEEPENRIEAMLKRSGTLKKSGSMASVNSEAAVEKKRSGPRHQPGLTVEELAKQQDAREARLMKYLAENEGDQLYGNVEDEKDLQRLVKEGQVSQAEAQRILARSRMKQERKKQEAHHQQFSGDGAAFHMDEAAMVAADYTTTEQMLDEALAAKQPGMLWSLMRTLFPMDKLEQRINKEEFLRGQKDFKHPFPRVNNMVKSTLFDIVIGLIMIFNGILIGFQVSLAGTADENENFNLIEHVLTTIFLLEIIWRLMADGWLWLCRASNIADVCLIFFTGVLTLWVLEPLGVDSPVMRALQVLRVLRLVRLIRMVRNLKIFRILWKLIEGVVESGMTLFWTYVVIGGAIYMFAILCVYQIGRSEDFAGDPMANEYFGNLPKSAITLFQTMTLDSWTAVARPLGEKQFRCWIVFVIAIAVLTLILLNLVTAVIVNNAMGRAEKDQLLQATLKEERVQADIADLRSIFLEIDEDGSGMLSRDEFLNAVENNERVQTKFQLLEIPLHDKEDIWTMMDTGTGEVSVEHFADYLRQMQGEAKAKDSFAIVQRIKRSNRRIKALERATEQRRNQLQKLQDEASSLQQELAMVLKEAKDFLHYIGKCLPEAAAPLSEYELEAQHRRWALQAVERALATAQQARPASYQELDVLHEELRQVLAYNLWKVELIDKEKSRYLQEQCQNALHLAEQHTDEQVALARQALQEAAMAKANLKAKANGPPMQLPPELTE